MWNVVAFVREALTSVQRAAMRSWSSLALWYCSLRQHLCYSRRSRHLASAHFALSQATSEAARVFTRSSSLDTAQVAARSQANEVWQDRGFSEVLDLSFSCQQSPCFVAGGGITLRLQTAVEIPLVGISVRIDDRQDVRIDQWRSL